VKFSKYLAALLVCAITPINIATAAPKTITVKPLTELVKLDATEEISGMLLNGKIIYLFGTSLASATTDGFLRAIDSQGNVLWNLPIDSGADDIFTAGTRDRQGNIWIVGASAKSPEITPTPTSSPSALNPDAVVLDPETPLRPDMTILKVWKVSSQGALIKELSRDVSQAILPRAVVATANGVAIGGSILTETGNAGFVVQTGATGVLSKLLTIGQSDTELNAIAMRADNSLIAFGSSTESLGGKKLVGLRDGVIVSISTKNKVTAVVRSTNSQSMRTWQNATNSLFLGGDAVTNGKTEAVVTKFSAALIPVWTTRYASRGLAIACDLTSQSSAMSFTSTSAIKGVTGWKASKGQVISLFFDSKGVITGAYGASSLKTVISVASNADLGLVVLGTTSVGVSIFHALTR